MGNEIKVHTFILNRPTFRQIAMGVKFEIIYCPLSRAIRSAETLENVRHI